MRYLLDTNICIYLMKQQPPEVAKRFQALRAGSVVMSVITFAELQHGIERCHPKERPIAERLLAKLHARIPILPLDEDAARQFAVFAAANPDRRRDAFDRLIAAHAVSLGLTLVTNNESDFVGYAGLVVENWVKPI